MPTAIHQAELTHRHVSPPLHDQQLPRPRFLVFPTTCSKRISNHILMSLRRTRFRQHLSILLPSSNYSRTFCKWQDCSRSPMDYELVLIPRQPIHMGSPNNEKPLTKEGLSVLPPTTCTNSNMMPTDFTITSTTPSTLRRTTFRPTDSHNKMESRYIKT